MAIMHLEINDNMVQELLFESGMVPRLTIIDDNMPLDPRAHRLHVVMMRALAPYLADQASALDALVKTTPDDDLMNTDGPLDTFDAIASDVLHAAIALYMGLVNLRVSLRNAPQSNPHKPNPHANRTGECLLPNCPIHGHN